MVPRAWIVRRQEANYGQQQTRIELVAAKALREGIAVRIKSELANRRVNVVADLSSTLQWNLQFESLSVTHRAIKRHPGHNFGRGKMATTASHLPNSIIRLLPDLFQMLDNRLLLSPGRLDGRKSVLSGMVYCVNELAVDIELELRGSCVTNAYRRSILIAG
jgi:hypothetical protein